MQKKMKFSRYNIGVAHEGNFYIFNQLSGALTQVDKELYTGLLDKTIDLCSINSELYTELHKSHFICDDDLIEENVILYANKTFRYSNDVARVTVLPTINCNFKCWYCYESHKESKMTQQAMTATLEFCKNLISQHRVRVFQLDWFGGEPLLYFDEVLYPLSLKLKKICDEKGVLFRHTITTNGYLISNDMIEKMIEIELKSFQITLDGDEAYHNRTRYSKDDKQTYRTIVQSITLLCQKIKNVNMVLRINYTPKNVSTIENIITAFPKEVRGCIWVEPQLVWQFKNQVNVISDVIKEKMEKFSEAGFKIGNVSIPRFNCGCYVENMLQYVVIYDLTVYKCTARDFLSPKTSIGKISIEGKFEPNNNYYNYFTSSYMENEHCMSCDYLPSCCGMCIQKKIEGSIPQCPKKQIAQSLRNKLLLVIKNL